MTTLQQKIAVMQAFADGKTIEACRRGGEWFQCEIEPYWDWTVFEYRVKRVPREWWVNVYGNGACSLHSTPDEAYKALSTTPFETVHVREVID